MAKRQRTRGSARPATAAPVPVPGRPAAHRELAG